MDIRDKYWDSKTSFKESRNKLKPQKQNETQITEITITNKQKDTNPYITKKTRF